ncbi:MAG: imidazoleglycerol-phosphate dehydratase HisB [Gammaproteobacteria bacterium]|nr:imidazoleglycerol-phosphate dehydratase HisB [Gammaproteobacteria bacterium]
MSRTADFARKTQEVDIVGSISLDGTGQSKLDTGVGFLDHMLSTLAKHARFDLDLTARGDLGVDDHHTAEDCGIAIGGAIDEALADRTGITRFGFAYAPLDEALCRAVVDLSGRGWAEVGIPFTRETIGDLATENIQHFLVSMAVEARMALHVDLIRGENNHHMAEAAFKAVALALRSAVSVTGGDVPSTKGTLR